MSTSKVARRYAMALVDLAGESKDHAKVGKELESFAAMWRGSKELQDAMLSPVVSDDDKLKVLEALFAKAKLGKTTQNFLRVLLEHDRLSEIEAIEAEFRAELDRMGKRIRAEVISAVPLAKPELDRIQAALQKLTGGTVELESRVDASIIGGVITRIGNVVLDGSVRTDLDMLRDRLLA